MKTITITSTDKHQQSSFLHMVKANTFWASQLNVGERYKFLEFPDRQFIRLALCVHIEKKKLEEITEQSSFLLENCDLEIFHQVMSKRKIGLNDVVYLATFTGIHASKKHLPNVTPVFD